MENLDNVMKLEVEDYCHLTKKDEIADANQMMLNEFDFGAHCSGHETLQDDFGVNICPRIKTEYQFETIWHNDEHKDKNNRNDNILIKQKCPKPACVTCGKTFAQSNNLQSFDFVCPVYSSLVFHILVI